MGEEDEEHLKLPFRIRRKIVMDSDDEKDIISRKRRDSKEPALLNMSPLPATAGLAALPTEILQHIFLNLLLSCLHDYDTGERNMRSTVLALAATSHVCRSNIAAVIRMLRKEISVGGTLVNHCARPWEMRVLVLGLDWNLSTGTTVRIRIERYRDIRVEANGKRLKLMIDGGHGVGEEDEDEDQS
jgi:hypothetical protein